MNQAGYYRYPTLSGDSPLGELRSSRVVFVCEDDLWTVPLTGGTAVRLTANLGEVSRPVLSPDGKLLAFTGREEGHPEVYCMPATGGEATRLTFTGSASVTGWTPDGKIVFSSSATQPFRRMPKLYAIDSEGGLPEELPFGVANAVSFGPEGGVVIGRNISDPARWKRYRGGTAGVLWVDAQGDGNFRPLIQLKGNLAAPMWVGDRIYFLSDHEGIGNLYSCTPAGVDLQRHTFHREYYVRHASTDGQRIVYHAGADLSCFDPATQTDTRIAVDFFSPRVQRQRKFVEASEFLDSYDLHPEGHSTTLTTRGKAFAFSNWEGAVLSLGQTETTGRYRLMRWLNDKKRLVCVSDRTGVEALEILSLELGTEAEILEGLDIGRVNGLEVSPTADQVILTNHRQELIWIDLTTKEQRILDRSDFARIQGFSWSPDGQWVAYSCAESQLTFSIKLCRLEDGSLHRLTPPRFRDVQPAFDPGGKFLYFLSVRDFNPVYDAIYFDLGFPKGMRPFLISLQKETPNPFVAQSKLLNGDKEKADEQKTGDKAEDKSGDAKDREKDKDSGKAEKKIQPIKIDLEGIDRRILGFPVTEGRYGQIWGVEGKVLFTSFPVMGSLERRNGNGKATLELYDFEAQKQERLACEVSSFRVARDNKTVIYRSGHRLRVCSTNPQDKERAKKEPGKDSGWLRLDRIRVSVTPAQEWQQMFKEIWRLQQQQFWTADMSGVDWNRVYDRYRPLLDRIATRSEFSDLIWEMQGELGTSHAYEYGGDYRDNPDYYLGFLGADFQYDAETDGYRITHIVQGDSWTDHDSPLNQIGLNVREGDILLAVNGQRVGRHRSPQELLVHQSCCDVSLTFAARPEEDQSNLVKPEVVQLEVVQFETETEAVESDTADPEASASEPKPTTRTVSVKTLNWETHIRYREWVERNHQQVTEASSGRIGYLHIPDMGAGGYAEFHRYYFAEVQKQGLIVDVRYNGGGHVSQLLLEKLARERIGYDVSRWGKPDPYPSDSVLGPIVALTDENAGSDGDIFSHCFKLMKLGTLIGKRTWGGVIGISPSHSLVDGSVVTQPEYSFWFKDVGWGVENYGTDPDIEVEITPQDWRQGKDSQLEKAIEIALAQLEQQEVELPNFGDRPYLPLP